MTMTPVRQHGSRFDGDAGEPRLVAVGDLVRHFRKPRTRLIGKAEIVRAVDGVSFTLARGETLGVVGESGCGKSTLGRILLGIDRPTSGTVQFGGEDITRPDATAWRRHRRDLQMVFQDAFGALDPRLPVGVQIGEPLEIHGIGDASERAQKVADILDAVRLPASAAARFPHELSGGQQQRVVIARALILRPQLVVCDEAVASLDVSIQAQIVNLLVELQERLQLTYVFISHDLKVVRHISDRVAIMYLGKIVEIGARDAIFAAPLHPYTQALMSAIPVPDPARRRTRILLEGDPPSPIDPPPGCRFHTRCRYAVDQCASAEPQLRRLASGGSEVACHRAEVI